MFYDSPIIGHGPGMFRFVCHKFTYNEFSCTTHPHNFYLQLLAETGTFGFLFLLIFFIQLVSRYLLRLLNQFIIT
jgi:O-antigen ligase